MGQAAAAGRRPPIVSILYWLWLLKALKGSFLYFDLYPSLFLGIFPATWHLSDSLAKNWFWQRPDL